MPPPAELVGEQVVLVVPAQPEMWAVVRMTAIALAARLDFSFEEVEDLRLAVTELCGLCASEAEADARCECRFMVTTDRFEMDCFVAPVSETAGETLAGAPSGTQQPMSMLELSLQILEATVDRFTIDPPAEGVRHGHLRKDRGSSALR